jgi:hypothetical protein
MNIFHQESLKFEEIEYPPPNFIFYIEHFVTLLNNPGLLSDETEGPKKVEGWYASNPISNKFTYPKSCILGFKSLPAEKPIFREEL